MHEGVLNTECQEIMGSNKMSKQCGFNILNKHFLGGEFIQDVFDDLIFNPLQLKGFEIQLINTLENTSMTASHWRLATYGPGKQLTY